MCRLFGCLSLKGFGDDRDPHCGQKARATSYKVISGSPAHSHTYQFVVRNSLSCTGRISVSAIGTVNCIVRARSLCLESFRLTWEVRYVISKLAVGSQTGEESIENLECLLCFTYSEFVTCRSAP